MARILITNDDGVSSQGLHAVAIALHNAGHDVLAVAPSGERSGWGAGVGTLDDGAEFSVEQFSVPGYEEIAAWGVDGPPAFCVLTAMLETFGEKPELVISGSNDGANCGRGILHSGTVGGAMIAQNFGISGIALSQKRTEREMLWNTSGLVAVAAANWILDAPRKTVLNINIPNETTEEIKGARLARIAAFGTTKTSLTGTTPGNLQIKVSPRDVKLSPDTDTALVDEGYITITNLVGYRSENDQCNGAAASIENYRNLSS